MLSRVLEPQVLEPVAPPGPFDRPADDSLVGDFLRAHGPCRGGELLDVAVGTPSLPIRLCFTDPAARVLAVDLSGRSVEFARRKVEHAGLSGRIRVTAAESDNLPYGNGRFEAVIADAVVHHIPDPWQAVVEMARLVGPGGTLLVRDLCRPDDDSTVDRLVQTRAGSEVPEVRASLEAAFHAALTIEEVRDLVDTLGLPPDGVTMTSDWQWTWVWHRPA